MKTKAPAPAPWNVPNHDSSPLKKCGDPHGKKPDHTIYCSKDGYSHRASAGWCVTNKTHCRMNKEELSTAYQTKAKCTDKGVGDLCIN